MRGFGTEITTLFGFAPEGIEQRWRCWWMESMACVHDTLEFWRQNAGTKSVRIEMIHGSR